ncbi:hypothetical protein SAMN05216388_102032 [Halorientalis persicus]|uniref:Uncharacterized protein n=1 Tax=Halorientalis persicus TaxID=1367881 RepID=A0A1H8STM1_9EURY|nr:hypothetical protein [Halorientalis persicus]SEO82001.1 hypothetical protein SAMN05216388_102032 [Halorientalis persicus]
MSARAQTNLPALAVALLVLTTTAALGMALADGAFASAERDSGERRVAVALSERLVGPAGPLTTRANVLNATAVENLTANRLQNQYPVVGDRAVRVRLDDRTLVETGTPDGGTTIRRIVLVRETQTRRYEPALDIGNTTTIPRRTDRVRLTLDPPPRTVLHTVRANGRAVFHNASGLQGNVTADLSRFETTRLAFSANRTLSTGDVTVTYVPAEETKSILEVTVDAR